VSFPKKKRVVLKGQAYLDLQRLCFDVDNWRCKICNRLRPLQAHHMIPRSLGRIDELQNLISLCAECHELVTQKFLSIEWDDVEQRTVIIKPQNLLNRY